MSLQGSSASTASQAADKSSLGKDDFLKLLLAQVANQDPLSPMDNQAFVAQLAQFSSVEQLQSANGTLTSMVLAQAAGNQTAAASLVGKDVMYRSDKVELKAGGPAALHGNLGSEAATVTAVITDASGRTVRTLHFSSSPAGAFTGTWDGRDDKGAMLPAGQYKTTLTAADTGGKPIETITAGTGRVSGISFSNGAAELVVGGVRIKLADVIQIDQAT
jgi:flagellar basal-body rod modification protein FlgD